MAWNELTLTRVKDKLLKAEYDALSTVSLPTGRTWSAMSTAELASTSNQVRGYCPPGTARGDGTTIPDELEDAALAFFRMKMFTRFPELKRLWTKERQEEYLQAIALLERWADGKYHVAPPATAADPEDQGSSSAGAEQIATRSRRYTRDTMAGL